MRWQNRKETQKYLKKRNKKRLTKLNAKEQIIEAITLSQTQKELKPMADNTGAIVGTQDQKTLKLKIGSKIIMTANVDTKDSLTNGTFGEIIDFEKQDNRKISAILVEFKQEKNGRELRKRKPDLQKKYPGRNITAIKKYEQEYTLTGKAKSGTIARAIQFPVRLSFAATTHKVQGMTIKKPHCQVIDLRARLQANQAYIMLNRVQELNHLFILGYLPKEKIFASSEALTELERMKKKALNNKMMEKAVVTSMNIYSLKKHFQDMKSSSKFTMSDVICIQETHMPPQQNKNDDFQLSRFNAHFNSIGGRKGILKYFTEKYSVVENIKEDY